ncbi:hypothetical protein M422DRAFT_54829 [Sphaerobolus stellatus SS14]|uniref:Uncharacterized protein n=1 Tax=Sphaerobolus stellatus (strain SS14) TaxID=990650 RepID=A0A0C9U1M3_SPHS4|nr:hypothetical protein M422DRAFT_54829 [Sphaerobolus stellatus SS14]
MEKKRPCNPFMAEIDLIKLVGRDIEISEIRYQAIDPDHYIIGVAKRVMQKLADKIEDIIRPEEPYEVNLLAKESLSDSSDPPLPVIVVAMINPSRLEPYLPPLLESNTVHLFDMYPASSANNGEASRHPLPLPATGMQTQLPVPGASIGLVTDQRHTFTLGGYIRLSSSPKDVFVLTVPLNLGLGTDVTVPKGTEVTQPSAADCVAFQKKEEDIFKELLERDKTQAYHMAKHRKALAETFPFARLVTSSHDQLDNEKWQERTFDEKLFQIRRQSTRRRKPFPVKVAPSNEWAILQVTRETAVGDINKMAKPRSRWSFGSKHGNIRQVEPMLTVTKCGRTTGKTLGKVNGVKSLYRLPRDGNSVRREDWALVCHSLGGAIGFPGDAGAVVYAHEADEVDELGIGITETPTPCGMIVGTSGTGYVAFMQDLENIVRRVKEAGLGDMAFVNF